MQVKKKLFVLRLSSLSSKNLKAIAVFEKKLLINEIAEYAFIAYKKVINLTSVKIGVYNYCRVEVLSLQSCQHIYFSYIVLEKTP